MSDLHSYLQQHTNPQLQTTLEAIAACCVDIEVLLRRGALAGILGSADNTNVQGEQQKKLDVISNDMLKQALAATPTVLALASEEEDDIVNCNSNGCHLVSFDPLDGSSNIDINAPVGTIFSLYQHSGGGPVQQADFLRCGHQQIAAGYVLYGSATKLVITHGDGVQVFVLDPEHHLFRLINPRLTLPHDTGEYAINASNQRFWAAPMQNYITELQQGSDGPRGKNFNMRWVAAMVAEVHRVLTRSGIFAYPWDSRDPGKAGKLRLMYEANPMAMLVEQAGGLAWTDKQRILDVQPHDIHQRVPVILGSANEVKTCLAHHGVSA